ncbi:transposase [Streptomyces shenzhenensis]|uniref:transposase n=1 Tax=Streptomyces shenzhenensis TaxID=943815 RepID=UPI003556844C
MGRGDLSDEQWAVLEPLLPAAMRGRPAVGRRRLIDGIRWRVRTGAQWRDVPQEYGPWQAVRGLFRRWQWHAVRPVLPTRLQARAPGGSPPLLPLPRGRAVCRAQ